MKRIAVVLALAAIGLALTVGLPALASPRAVMTDSLVAYWRLDEISGTRADATGRGNTLTDNNTVAYTTGVLSNAALFVRANNESLTISSTDVIAGAGDVDFTVAGWAKLTTAGIQQGIIAKRGSGSSEIEYMLRVSAANAPVFYIGNGVGLVTVAGPTLSAGQWFFWALRHNGPANLITVTINLTNTGAAWTGGTIATASNMALGNDPSTSSYMDGAIDEVGFWKRTLTDAELVTLYNSGAGCSYETLDSSCVSATNTPTNTPTGTATNTPTNTPTPTPDYASWPFPTSYSSSGFTANGGATLSALYQVEGTVITWTEQAGLGDQYVQFNYANIPAATLTTLHWRVWGYYSGAHNVKAQCYAPATGWSSLTGDTTDLPQASAITYYQFAVSIADCVSSGTLQLRFFHASNGVGTHVLVVDQSILHGVSVATSTPTPPPGTATNTPTITPTPTKTSTPDYVIQATLSSGNVLQIERRVTFGEALIVIVLLALIVLTVLRFIYDATRVLG